MVEANFRQNNKEVFYSSFLTVVVYVAFFYCFQFFLHYIGALRLAPNSGNIIFWDGGWYRGIAEEGYKANSPNVGFFMLFPLIWKFSFLGVWGISVLNILFFATGFSILSTLYPVSLNERILWLSFPSLFYMFIPYTEALFFLLSSICFYGIAKDRRLLIWISLFLIALTRSTAIFLLPAFLVMSLLRNQKKHFLKSLGSFLIDYALPITAGLFLFFFYQYYKTGEWFIYFRIQREHFGHSFSIPKLPFSGQEGDRRTWISALGFFTDAAALLLIIVLGLRWLVKDRTAKDTAVTASLVYLSLTLIQTLFFNPVLGGGSGTTMVGIHRYSFATAFFFVFLFYITRTFKYRLSQCLFVFLFANVVWLMFNSYVHIQRFLFFNGLTIYIFLYIFGTVKKNSWMTTALIAINFSLQIYLLQDFINVIYTD
jgi:hypothetical protein